MGIKGCKKATFSLVFAFFVMGVAFNGMAMANTAPVAKSKKTVVKQNEVKKFRVKAIDADKDKLFYRLVAEPKHGEATINRLGVVTYMPDAGFYGTDRFSFRANDGSLDSNIARVNLKIKPVNLDLVDQGKALVNNTRTWVSSFSQLATPAEAFSAEAEIIVETLSSDATNLLEYGVDVAGQVMDAIDRRLDAGKPLPSKVSIKNNAGKVVGVADVNVQIEPTTAIAIQLTINNKRLDLSLTLDQKLVNSAVSDWLNGKATLAMTGEMESPSSKVNVNDVSVKLSVDSNQLDANGTPSWKSVSLNGGIGVKASGSEVSGQAVISLVALRKNKEAWSQFSDITGSLSLKRLKLGPMTVSNMQSSESGLMLDLSIDNAATFDTFAFLSGEDVLFVYQHDEGRDTAGFKTLARKRGVTDLQNALYYMDGLPWAMPGVLTSLSGYNNKGVYKSLELKQAPAKAPQVLQNLYQSSQWVQSVSDVHIGYYAASCYQNMCYPEGSYASALITLDKTESAKHFLKGKLKLSGMLALAGQPKATIDVVFDRYAYDKNQADIKIDFDTGELIISAKNVGNDNADKLKVTFSDNAGAILSLHFEDGFARGELKVNNKVIGVV